MARRTGFLGRVLVSCALVTMFVLGSARAEDDPNVFHCDRFNFDVRKPADPHWKIPTIREYDRIFQDPENILAAVCRYTSEDADPKDEQPHILMYITDIDKTYIDTYGRKGLAKAIFENSLSKYFKNPKNITEPKNSKSYKFSKRKSVTEFAFDGESAKYGGAQHIHVIIYKGKLTGYIIVTSCAPGDQKKYAKDIKYILDNIEFKGKED